MKPGKLYGANIVGSIGAGSQLAEMNVSNGTFTTNKLTIRCNRNNSGIAGGGTITMRGSGSITATGVGGGPQNHAITALIDAQGDLAVSQSSTAAFTGLAIRWCVRKKQRNP